MLITFLAPSIATFALKFGPPEFFAVYLLTFCSFVGLGKEDKHKTIISMALGLPFGATFLAFSPGGFEAMAILALALGFEPIDVSCAGLYGPDAWVAKAKAAAAK